MQAAEVKCKLQKSSASCRVASDIGLSVREAEGALQTVATSKSTSHSRAQPHLALCRKRLLLPELPLFKGGLTSGVLCGKKSCNR